MQQLRKILIMGLPGAGKTTLAQALAPRLNAVHFNADAVRANINRILASAEPTGSSTPAAWAGCAIRSSRPAAIAIADFICPTPATRAAFIAGGPAFIDLC